MVMGPQDNGFVVNKQLLWISRFLERWFHGHLNEDGEYLESQGWLEYLWACLFRHQLVKYTLISG